MKNMGRRSIRRAGVDAAWTQLLTNLLVLPGAGSLMGGRRSGYVQILLSAVGAILSLMFMVGWGREWLQSGHFVFPSRQHLLQGLTGVGVFLAAWLWSLATGYSLLREARVRLGEEGADELTG
ncbi:MAG: hypothetical protein RI897_3329 [Verrucomicrobiota bacterium]